MSSERLNFTLLPNQNSMTKASSKLSYGQMYYAKLKAKEYGITVEQYLASKGTRSNAPKVKTTQVMNKKIDFSKVTKLRNLDVNDNMLKTYKTGQTIDTLFSYEGGIPVGTNIMCTGDPGVGKTTLLLHSMANLQLKNKNLKCLFVSCEMGKIQMFKYTKRFKIFGEVETIFSSDFLNEDFKEVMEQLLNEGYDYILIDSIAEVFEHVRDTSSMSQKQAETWLVDLCVKHNEGGNKRKVFSTFLLIQQVTKSGVFVGSNKLKHLTDAHMEMRRESERDGGGTYIEFTKNRNGLAGIRFTYQLSNDDIYYGTIENEEEPESVTISSEKASDKKPAKQFELANK